MQEQWAQITKRKSHPVGSGGDTHKCSKQCGTQRNPMAVSLLATSQPCYWAPPRGTHPTTFSIPPLYWQHPLFNLFFFFQLQFYFIFKRYKIALVLPNIKMNLPQVYILMQKTTSTWVTKSPETNLVHRGHLWYPGNPLRTAGGF